MLWEFLRVEVKYRLRQPGPWIFMAVFALLCFAATTTDAVRIGGGAGKTAINSPFVIEQFMGIMSVFSVLVVTAYVATAVVRDYQMRFDGLLFTRPLRKFDYLAGRFSGAVLVTSLVVAGNALGMLIGSFMWWLDAERLVAHSLWPYLHALLVFGVPNVVVPGTFFFAIATLTKRILPAYVGVAAFLVLYVVSQVYVGKVDNELLTALADPFGLSASSLMTRYWTVAERNTMVTPFEGYLLANRLLWLGIGVVVFALTVWRFRFDAPRVSESTKSTEKGSPKLDRQPERPLPAATLRFDFVSELAQWWTLTRVELKSIVRSTPFLVLAMLGMLNLVASSFGILESLYGTAVHPVTHLMVTVIESGFSIFLLIVIVFYAGEAIHRERGIGLALVHDALPVPNWVPMMAKLTALVGAVAVLLLVGIVSGLGIQLSRGFTDVEFGLYAKGLFGMQLAGWATLAVLAIFFQVIANQKYLGIGLVILHFIADSALPAMGYEHKLYNYGSGLGAEYSDMNAYGHFAHGAWWFGLYWGFVGVILMCIANLFWIRGTDNRWRLRIREARRRVTRGNTAILALAVLGFVGTGSYIYYNTNVVNEYVPSDDRERLQVEYEQKYKQYEGLPQPRLKAVDVSVDIFPVERRIAVAGTLRLQNLHDIAIETLHVTYVPDNELRQLDVPGATLELDDSEIGYRIYRFEHPLAPKAELEIRFEQLVFEQGIKNSGSNTSLVYNGTFVNNGVLVPHFGYDPSGELSDENERRERGLPERPRMAKVDDAEARKNTYISAEADWIDFKATVSTSSDQIALAPGYLQREWTEGDRRYFRYEMDAPILNFYAFLSARYEVVADEWNGVKIEVYHHPGHEYNVERMIYAVKRSLEYYTKNFSPYQHRQVRIVEFPRYASFAQSFPNTIPYSESIGFIADLRDEEDIDYVFYVTAHEIAHQWWAHQVIGGNVQGSTLMSETLSQYSALMVMEEEYGREQIGKFLRHELNSYLAGRGFEDKAEVPLALVENQPYIHYNKGAIILYALREYIGEENLNRALKNYIAKVGFQAPPFTNSIEFIDEIRKVVPKQYENVIHDWFETITLFDNRVEEVEVTALPDGKWRVDATFRTVKLRADEQGEESQIAIDDWIEVSIEPPQQPGEHETLYSEKHHFTEEQTSLSFTVDAEPAKVGIDPRHLLIDRNPEDNLESVD